MTLGAHGSGGSSGSNSALHRSSTQPLPPPRPSTTPLCETLPGPPLHPTSAATTGTAATTATTSTTSSLRTRSRHNDSFGVELPDVGGGRTPEPPKASRSCSPSRLSRLAGGALGGPFGGGLTVVVLMGWSASYPSLLALPHLLTASVMVLLPWWAVDPGRVAVALSTPSRLLTLTIAFSFGVVLVRCP